MSNPKVSVVMPFVDEGVWLGEAIESILGQTFTEFELILIDNGGHPESRRIADSHAASDERIILLHEPEKGVAQALNRGIKEAKGAFIARMDADDIALPERLGTLSEMLENNPDIGVVSSRVDLFPLTDYNGGFQRHVEWTNGIISHDEHALQRFIDSPVAHPAVMMRTGLFDLFGCYSLENIPEDYELWLRWMDAGVKFQKHEMSLLKWRDHTGRLTRSHRNYSEDAFLETKAFYLAKWLSGSVRPGRSLIVCGSSPNIRNKIALLEARGVVIDAVTDVKQHSSNRRKFIPIGELDRSKDAFILNLIARSDLREPIRELLNSGGRKEGVDFLMAG